MVNLSFISIRLENSAAFIDFMHSYVKELDEHLNKSTSEEIIDKWIKSIIEIQGDSDRHLEYCFADDKPIGFLYGKVDKTENRGYKKPEYGYIMEFYVIPECRLKGYGKTDVQTFRTTVFKRWC